MIEPIPGAPPSAFERASALEPMGERRFRATIPDGWQQGRGAFGGLVLGTLLRAIQRCEPDPARAVRTLTGDLAGPAVTGDGEIVVEVVRRGSNQSNIRAELRQNGERIAFALAVLSSPRPAGLAGQRPRVTPPVPFASLVRSPMSEAPIFTQYYDYRPTRPIFAGAPEPVAEGWVREVETPRTIDAPALVALLDAWWPAFFSATRGPRVVATVSFTAEILVDPRTLDPAAPFFYQARTVCDHEGFQLELRELYDASGALIAANQQTFVILK
jgi:acyl-CoA thioesterase